MFFVCVFVVVVFNRLEMELTPTYMYLEHQLEYRGSMLNSVVSQLALFCPTTTNTGNAFEALYALDMQMSNRPPRNPTIGVQHGLCPTWSKLHKTGFLATQLQ